MLVLSTMTCLMKTRGSTLSPLRYCASTSTPRRPHRIRIEFDRHGDLAVLERVQRRRHAVHAGHDRLVGAARGDHSLRGAERDIVVGAIDRFEVRIGDHRVLGLLDAALARERSVGTERNLNFWILRHHFGVAVGQIAEGGRAARAEQHGDLAFAADCFRGPLGDVAADLLFVHRDVNCLIGRGRAARDRNDRDICGFGGVIGGVDADGVDRRDQNALDSPGDEVLYAVDLLDLVLVGRNRRDVPAKLAGASADAFEHHDVERIVVLRERDADGDFLLCRRGRDAIAKRGRQHGDRQGGRTKFQHGTLLPL